tara:strand:- start:3645 stop:4148 length:504 start_codon:yes stop_codon:yes gene_type:complete
MSETCRKTVKESFCYILRSTSDTYGKYTYNGYTNNLGRRIRQHNNELAGGAKSTKHRGPWVYICIIGGFEDKIEALQAEWKIRTVQGRRRPSKYNNPVGRIQGLANILRNKIFTSNSKRDICDIPLTIIIDENFVEYLIDIPPHIQIVSVPSESDILDYIPQTPAEL